MVNGLLEGGIVQLIIEFTAIIVTLSNVVLLLDFSDLAKWDYKKRNENKRVLDLAKNLLMNHFSKVLILLLWKVLKKL